MTTVPDPDSARCYAELTSGEILVPGVTAHCSGPDAFGCCDRSTADRPCAGATWHYPGSAGWQFIFRADSELCPVTILDPLGPLPVPQD
jgi:hypothetical protein